MLKKIKWNVNSPRFAEAQLTLGYTDEDVTLKDIKYFQEEDYQDKKIVKVRYNHHLLNIKIILNEIIEKRLDIIGLQDEVDRRLRSSRRRSGKRKWIDEDTISMLSKYNTSKASEEDKKSRRKRAVSAHSRNKSMRVSKVTL